MAEIYLKLRVKSHLEDLPGEGHICPICGDESWGIMVYMVTAMSTNDGRDWYMERQDVLACSSCAGDKVTRDLDNLDGDIVPKDVNDAIDNLLRGI